MPEKLAERIAEKYFSDPSDEDTAQCREAIREFAEAVAEKIIEQGAGCTRRTQANMNWAARLLLREAGIGFTASALRQEP